MIFGHGINDYLFPGKLKMSNFYTVSTITQFKKNTTLGQTLLKNLIILTWLFIFHFNLTNHILDFDKLLLCKDGFEFFFLLLAKENGKHEIAKLFHFVLISHVEK